MSFTDRLVLWLHIGFAIFTVGPLALAISSTPRYIRRRDVPVLRYLSRITLIFTAGALLVLVFGVVLGQLDHDFSHPWLAAAMTLFVVAIVLLVLIMRDQRRAIRAITPANVAPAASAAGDPPEHPDQPEQQQQPDRNDGAEHGAREFVPAGTGGATLAEHVASVERGRIAGLSGVVNLIWLVILVLMVWQP
jgi:hypothetical protein